MFGIVALLLLFLFGITMTYVISNRLDYIERIGLSLLIGIGLQTLAVFLFYVVGLRFTFINVIGETVGLILFNLLILTYLGRLGDLKLSLKRMSHGYWELRRHITTLGLFEKSLLLGVLGLIAASFILGIYWPVKGWDSLVLYDFRAITFIATGGMEDGIRRGYFFGYPLLTSLAHMWFYFFGANPHLAYWTLYCGFLMIVYANLKKMVSQVTTYWTVFLIATTLPLFNGSFFDYTNMPYTVFLTASLLYLVRWYKDRDNQFIIYSMILAGLSTWTRGTEPFWIINLFFALVIGITQIKQGLLKTIGVLLLSYFIFFSIQQPWKIYETAAIGGARNISGQASIGTSALVGLNVDLLIDVVSTTWKDTVPTWQPFFAVSILLIVLNFRKALKNWVLVGLVAANVALLFFGTYVFSLIWTEGWKSIIDSQQRLSTFLIPLFIFIIAIMADEYIQAGVAIIHHQLTSKLKS